MTRDTSLDYLFAKPSPAERRLKRLVIAAALLASLACCALAWLAAEYCL